MDNGELNNSENKIREITFEDEWKEIENVQATKYYI